MQISSRFTVALHIFACVEYFRDKCKVTSDFLASSINTNPVIIRRILGQLSKAGLVRVMRGTGGIEITRPLRDITFLDVYKAELFSIFMRTRIQPVPSDVISMRFLTASYSQYRKRWKTG